VDFVAVDVETANADIASVCQVGIVAFENGRIKESWQTLVNPEDYFDPVNVSIHGIDRRAVRAAPIFPEVYGTVCSWFAGSVVASHTPFDRLAIERAAEKYGLEQMCCAWLDTARVARRAWPQFSQRGYGLANVAGHLGISFVAHNAEEDARAAGELLVHAMEETGLAIHEWQERVRKPIGMGAGIATVAVNGNREGDLYGESIVFTGRLTIARRLAAQMAADAGCDVADSVSESTTLLVVGDQDIRHLAGHEKSSKHRKAEGLIARGAAIRILGESDFRCLLGLQDSSASPE
jgi:DNA polymerase-3 subunit epsilon